MFEDIELYIKDLKKYYEDIQEMNADGILPDDRKRVELDSKFKDMVRKYLPSSLNVINTTFNYKFSLYKEGTDFDAKFKMIETKVKKTKLEVEAELMNLRNYKDINTLSESDKRQLELATDILITYSDEDFALNIGNSKFLNEALSTPSVQAVNYGDDLTNEQPNLIPGSSEIQYNPYAGQPVDLTNNYSNDIDVNSFNTNVQQVQPSMNVENSISFANNSSQNDSEYANSDLIDVSSLSIFNSNPNVGNNQNNQY